MFKKLMISGAVCAIVLPVYGGDDCMRYKIHPRITVEIPNPQKQIVQPSQQMDLLHGDVIATLVDNYDITGDITDTDDGFCVSLKSVAATIGYSDFLVQIDMRNNPGSCEYNAILAHEQEHINAYNTIIRDFFAELHAAVFGAADSVMPVFVSDAADIDAAMDALNAAIRTHPDVILAKQKIRAAEEIRNHRIDENDTGDRLKKCAAISE